MEILVPGTTVLSIIKSPRKYQELFQEKPDEKCTFTMNKSKNSTKNGGFKNRSHIKNRNHSNSRESQQSGAWKELEVLKRNNRIPTKATVLRFQRQFKTKNDLTDLLTKMFRYLADQGIVAAVALEGTTDDFGKPNNRVHCHVLIDDKDDPRSKKSLLALFVKACKLRELERGKDIKIGKITELPQDFTFDYFVKWGKHGKGIPLFQKGLWIQKFRYIGGWFTKPKPDLWEEYREEIRKIKAAKDTAKTEKSSTKKSASKKTTNPAAKKSTKTAE